MPVYNMMNLDDSKRFDEFYEMHSDECEAKLGIGLADLSIFCGENVISNTESAMRKALEMVDSGIFKRVLIINTSTKSRRILKLARQVSPEGRVGTLITKSPVCIIPGIGGQLGRSFGDIEMMIQEHGFDAVIINSWEYASMSYRLREELLFHIRRATEHNELTIIIYSQAAIKDYTPGALMRGSLGKLGIMACKITSLPMQEKIEKEQREIQGCEEKSERSEQFISEEGKLDGKFILTKKKREYMEIAPPIPSDEEVLVEIKV